MFPLYLDDKIASLSISAHQQAKVDEMQELLSSGELKLVWNSCLCKNSAAEADTVLSEKDRYGFPIASLLCCECGLVRSSQVFDSASNDLFYSRYYREIYVGKRIPDEQFFKDQINRGKGFLAAITAFVPLGQIGKVVEIGSGAGGILYPFQCAGLTCEGYDLDPDYLAYGRGRGLDLHLGDYRHQLADRSAGLLILSHVMEHFLNPIDELKDIIPKVAPGKFLLIEVPGIFNIVDAYKSPAHYFQNAHVYSFYKDYLVALFRFLGLKVIYSDERCVFLVQKPDRWLASEVESTFDPVALKEYPQKIAEYLERAYALDDVFFPWRRLKRRLSRIAGRAFAKTRK